jgi:cation diffusion facilitator family transporter
MRRRKEEDSIRLQAMISVTIKGMIINLLLVIVKIVSGVLGRSSAMIADGIHSLSDTLSDFFLLLGLRLADKPPDKTHKYGHGKIETLLTVVISLMILLAGFFILSKSFNQIYQFLFHDSTLRQPGLIALLAAILSLFLKEYLYRLSKTTGLKFKSSALCANAWHHRTDALTSVAAFLGIGGAMLLGEKWVVLDPLAALVVSLFIIVVGIKLLKDSIKELLETSLGEEKEAEIIANIKSVEGVIKPHNLKTRRLGNYIVIDVHIEVNRFLNVIQAHNIATKVETSLRNQFGNETYVSVHIEPFDYVS